MNVSKEQKQYRIENAMDTLRRAEQIRKDAGLMRDVKKAANELQRSVGGAPSKPAPVKKRK